MKKSYGTWKGTPREQIPWHPSVDLAKCVSCRKCFEFCRLNNEIEIDLS
ncbi:MAG: hypothetical protein ACLQCB_09670 [Spirochaetia bacterium]